MGAAVVITKGDIFLAINAKSFDIGDVYVKLVNKNNLNDIRATRTDSKGVAVFKNIDFGCYEVFTRKNRKHTGPHKIDHNRTITNIKIELKPNRDTGNTGRILFIVKDGIYQQPVEGVSITHISPEGSTKYTDMLGEREFVINYSKNHNETDHNKTESKKLTTAQFEVLNPISNEITIYNFNLLPGNPVIIQQHSI